MSDVSGVDTRRVQMVPVPSKRPKKKLFSLFKILKLCVSLIVKVISNFSAY